MFDLYDKLARAGHSELVLKNGIPLIQRPETALFQYVLAGDLDAARQSEVRIKVEDTYSGLISLGEFRQRLMVCLEERPNSLSDENIDDLYDKCVSLQEVTRQCTAVCAIQEHLHESNLLLDGLYDVLRSKEVDLKRLREVFSDRADELVDHISEVQHRLSIQLPPGFAGAAEVRGTYPRRLTIQANQADMAYRFEFCSVRIEQALKRILELREQIERAQNQEQREEAEDVLQDYMFACESDLRGDNEYFLLLSSVFCSHGMWYQGYEAAEQGLRQMISTINSPSDADPQNAVLAGELLLAKASAYRNWILGRLDGIVAEASFVKVLKWCGDYLRLNLAWSQKIGHVDPGLQEPDARCFREISVAFGVASHKELRPQWPGEIPRLGEMVLPEDADYRDLYYRTAHKAYEVSKKGTDEVMTRWTTNNLLDAMTLVDRNADIERRYDLAREIEGWDNSYSLHTLACHYLSMAQRAQGRKSRNEWVATCEDCYVRGERLIPERHRYLRSLYNTLRSSIQKVQFSHHYEG